jgi:hypothetical protein
MGFEMSFQEPTFDTANPRPQPSVTITDHTVGSKDGNAVFVIPTGDYFPRYGGTLTFTLPEWFGTDDYYVFSSSAECTSDELEITQSPVVISNLIIIFSSFSSSGDTLTITCTDYRSPVYPKNVAGFGLSLSDAEQPAIPIIDYIGFELETEDLMEPITIDEDEIIPKFYNMETNDGIEHTFRDPINVQINAAIEFSFQMPIPTESGGCWLKLTFPQQIPLTAFPAQQLGFTVESIMSSDADGGYSTPVSTVLDYQAYSLGNGEVGNYVIIEGCVSPYVEQSQVMFQVKFFDTPQAVRDTAPFLFELYRSYDNFVLNKLIASGERAITANYFKSGVMETGYFEATLNYIQTAAAYTIEFTLQNDLPA